MYRRLAFFILGWAGLILLASCGPASSPAAPSAANPTAAAGRTLTVSAAASLTAAFNELGQSFQAANPSARVVFNYGGSQDLRAQIEQGATVDVFASADTKNMDALQTANLVASAPQTFAHNVLTVILPKANPAGIHELTDLSRPGLKIVLADASVPAGNYTLQILDKLSADSQYGAGFKTAVLANVVSKENNVKSVVSKVALGEADAGVVYTTDAQAASDRLGTISIPDRFNVIATYPIAVLKASANPALAKQFVDFVVGASGQAVLRKYGFVESTGSSQPAPAALSTRYEISAQDSGQTFTYTVTSRISIILDKDKYPKENLACKPASVLGDISNIPSVTPPLYAARYEGIAAGTAVCSDGDFQVTIKIVG